MAEIKGYLKDKDNNTLYLSNLLDFFYPIGTIYTSMNPTSPETLFGGTWIQIVDEFLYLTTSSKVTGGSNTHTHTTGNHTLTVSEMPSHSHNTGFDQSTNGGTEWLKTGGNSGGPFWNYGTYIQNSGGGGAHNHGNTGSASNVPQHITCYGWYRVG